MRSPAPFESAQLILKLYELRREPVVRRARAWFVRDFNPKTFDELTKLAGGRHSAWFRMVLGYWDMAASFVTAGAIDAAMFRAANSEVFATFAKVEPFLAELRAASHFPEFLVPLQTVVQETPGAAERTAGLRGQFRALSRGLGGHRRRKGRTETR
jgi:hypothetical protein